MLASPSPGPNHFAALAAHLDDLVEQRARAVLRERVALAEAEAAPVVGDDVRDAELGARDLRGVAGHGLGGGGRRCRRGGVAPVRGVGGAGGRAVVAAGSDDQKGDKTNPESVAHAANSSPAPPSVTLIHPSATRPSECHRTVRVPHDRPSGSVHPGGTLALGWVRAAWRRSGRSPRRGGRARGRAWRRVRCRAASTARRDRRGPRRRGRRRTGRPPRRARW